MATRAEQTERRIPGPRGPAAVAKSVSCRVGERPSLRREAVDEDTAGPLPCVCVHPDLSPRTFAATRRQRTAQGCGKAGAVVGWGSLVCPGVINAPGWCGSGSGLQPDRSYRSRVLVPVLLLLRDGGRVLWEVIRSWGTASRKDFSQEIKLL